MRKKLDELQPQQEQTGEVTSDVSDGIALMRVAMDRKRLAKARGTCCQDSENETRRSR